MRIAEGQRQRKHDGVRNPQVYLDETSHAALIGPDVLKLMLPFVVPLEHRTVARALETGTQGITVAVGAPEIDVALRPQPGSRVVGIRQAAPFQKKG